MSWRAIQDTVGLSRSLSELSDGAERLYWRMLAYTDSWGRLEGDPGEVKARCVPRLSASEEDVAGWMAELEKVGRIELYDVAGERVSQMVNFEENQPSELIRRRGPSKYPDLQGTPGSSGTSREAPGLKENKRESSSEAKASSRQPDELWDALASELRGQPATDSERGRWNKAVKEIRDCGGTPDELSRAARAFRDRYPNAMLTPTALSANWGSLLTSPNGAPVGPRCPECDLPFATSRRLVAHRERVHDVVAA